MIQVKKRYFLTLNLVTKYISKKKDNSIESKKYVYVKFELFGGKNKTNLACINTNSVLYIRGNEREKICLQRIS